MTGQQHGDPFRAYPPPFALTSDMLFVVALCPAAPLQRHFPSVPFLTVSGKAILLMWFSRIKTLCYHPTAGTVRCAGNHEGVPYNELNVIALLRRRQVFTPGIYATSQLTLRLGQRYGMPKQIMDMTFEAHDTAVRSHAADGPYLSFVRATLLTSGRWLGRLLTRLLPMWSWPVLFPSGSFIRALIQEIPRVQVAHLSSGQLELAEPWLPKTVSLLPLGVFIPELRMRLPAPSDT